MLRFRKLAYIAVLVAAWFCAAQATPVIIITHLPSYGSTDHLSGVVLNAAPDAYAVAVFIYVPRYGWVTKPTCGQPLTPVQADGSWTADITTGGSDTSATRVAALVVSTNYNELCQLGAEFLPTNIFAQAIASQVLTRTNPEAKWLSFSGYDWWVKTSAGLVGPGPNYFSDSTNNVWLDALEQLHLRITNRSNQWQCAELISARSFGFGSYRFELASRVDNLNPNAVLGLFTWSDDPAYAHREIDVECSRWADAANTNNAQFVVQPYDTAGHLMRYAVLEGEANSTQLFLWESNRVTFQSQRGSYSPNPNPSNVVSVWTYTLAVPQIGDENVRLNLWLFQGNPPTDTNEVEVIIKSFTFLPLGIPQPASLSNFSRAPDGSVHLSINGQFDWRYLVQASTNLLDWEGLGAVLATNTTADFLGITSPTLNRQFFRTLTLP